MHRDRVTLCHNSDMSHWRALYTQGQGKGYFVSQFRYVTIETSLYTGLGLLCVVIPFVTVESSLCTGSGLLCVTMPICHSRELFKQRVRVRVTLCHNPDIPQQRALYTQGQGKGYFVSQATVESSFCPGILFITFLKLSVRTILTLKFSLTADKNIPA